MTDAPASPAGYEDALAYLRALIPMTDDAFDLLEEAMRSRAFTVAELANADMVTQVLDAIESAVEKGTTFETFVNDVGALLEDSWGGEKPGMLETIFRTNVQTAYNAGSYAQRTDPDVLEARPYWMFDDVPDDRQSDICAAIHGTVLPADDPFWLTAHPPCHPNCRSQIVSLSPEEAEEMGLTAHPPNATPTEGFGAPPGADFDLDYSRFPDDIRADVARKTKGD